MRPQRGRPRLDLTQALHMEAGCELVTAGRDFGRFAGLRWRHPLLS